MRLHTTHEVYFVHHRSDSAQDQLSLTTAVGRGTPAVARAEPPESNGNQRRKLIRLVSRSRVVRWASPAISSATALAHKARKVGGGSLWQRTLRSFGV